MYYLFRLSEVASRELKQPNKFCRDTTFTTKSSPDSTGLSSGATAAPAHASAAPSRTAAAPAPATAVTSRAAAAPSRVLLGVPVNTTIDHHHHQCNTNRVSSTLPPVKANSAASSAVFSTAPNGSINKTGSWQHNSLLHPTKANFAGAVATTINTSTPMDISDEGAVDDDNKAAAGPSITTCQRLHWEQQRLATHQEELASMVVVSADNSKDSNDNNNDDDQPLDMSKTSRTISHRQLSSQQGAGGEQDQQKQLFSGLYLLVDTAMGLLDQQQPSTNHNMHCNPVVA
jgi:hypothetical protein